MFKHEMIGQVIWFIQELLNVFISIIAIQDLWSECFEYLKTLSYVFETHW